MDKVNVIIKKVNSEYVECNWEHLLEGLYEQRKQAVQLLKNKKAAYTSLVAGYLLIEAIKEVYGITATDIYIEKTQYGKPFVKGYDEFKYNISHSENYVAIAYGKKDIGIDIEQVRRADLKVANRFFHEDEIKYIAKEDINQDRRFFEIWTGKEAYLKYTGQGINVPLDSVVVEPEYSRIRDTKVEIQIKHVDDLVISVCGSCTSNIDYNIGVYGRK